MNRSKQILFKTSRKQYFLNEVFKGRLNRCVMFDSISDCLCSLHTVTLAKCVNPSLLFPFLCKVSVQNELSILVW